MSEFVLLAMMAASPVVAYRLVERSDDDREDRKAMADGLLHAAHILRSYADEHDNPDRAFGARANASTMVAKAAALKSGRLSTSFIRRCR